MPFSGSLKDVPLANIVQLVSASGKSGAFILQSGALVGRIFLRAGQIVHAQLGDKAGESAVFDLIGWKDASFVFKEDLETQGHSIRGSTMGLLMRASQQIDEWAVLRKVIPSTHKVPRLSTRAGRSSVSFSFEEWSVICRFHPAQTIDDLAAALEKPTIEICKTLYGLISRGLVELTDAVAN